MFFRRIFFTEFFCRIFFRKIFFCGKSWTICCFNNFGFVFRSTSTRTETLDTVHASTARISRCCQSDCRTCQVNFFFFFCAEKTNLFSTFSFFNDDSRCKICRRKYGEVVLPAMHGRVHAQVVASSSHGRRILRHRISPHGFHGASGVETETPGQSICCAVKKWKISFPFVIRLMFSLFSRLFGFKIHPLAYQLQYQVHIRTIYQLIDWLVMCSSINNMIDWLIDWLVIFDRKTIRLIDWLIFCWLISNSNDWLIDWLINKSIIVRFLHDFF